MKQISVIITGTTGMVGEGVLLECLLNQQVSTVLSISRKPTGISHEKLKEYLVSDFFSLNADKILTGYDACFFCAGISSVGMNEADYTRITYDATLHMATILAQLNPQMTFIYVSGASTDSSEKGKSMWARVKGRTENALMKLPFKRVYNFRPGLMKPVPGQKRVLAAYKYLGWWMFPVIKLIFPNSASTLTQVGQAMIKCATTDVGKSIIEVSDINRL